MTIATEKAALAIDGGAPAVKIDPDAYAEATRWPRIEEEEIAAAVELMRKGELSISDETKTLEREFADYIGVSHALAHNNGTAAIHAGLFGLGVGPGDEVIVASYTYWASAMQIFWLGAKPVFCDIDPRNLGPDPDEIESLITDKTKAVIVVHMWGMPGSIDRIVDICHKRGVKVFEDASHAHGSSFKSRKIGAWGDAAGFSLQSSKTCPSGEGGILVSNDPAVIEKATLLGHYERVAGLESDYSRFNRTCYGFKYRMSPLSAAIARRQVARLDEMNGTRNANCERLSERIRPLGFQTFDSTKEVSRVYYEFVVRLEPSLVKAVGVERLCECLNAEGAHVRPGRYPLLHEQPFFTERHMLTDDFPWEASHWEDSEIDFSRSLPRSERLVEEVISIPTFPAGDFDMVDQYAVAFEKVIGELTK